MGNANNDVAIVYGPGIGLEVIEKFWNDIHVAAHLQLDQSVPWENNLPIYVYRQPKLP